MAKTLQHEVFKDKIIKCRCGEVIGEQRMQGQILVLANGLIVFNYLCWKHDCGKSSNGKSGSWLAPILPEEKPTNANQSPDIGDIIHKALALKKQMKKFGYTLKQKECEYHQTDNAQNHAAQNSAS